jgi:hypothetical protein
MDIFDTTEICFNSGQCSKNLQLHCLILLWVYTLSKFIINKISTQRIPMNNILTVTRYLMINLIPDEHFNIRENLKQNTCVCLCTTFDVTHEPGKDSGHTNQSFSPPSPH